MVTPRFKAGDIVRHVAWPTENLYVIEPRIANSLDSNESWFVGSYFLRRGDLSQVELEEHEIELA
jgi:hypothetical protein